MLYRVVFTPEAQTQLMALYQYIATAASPNIANNYTSSLVAYCESLQHFPHRGTLRDDIRPGLRITNYKGKTSIAFAVNECLVSILGIYHGGRDYEAILTDEQEI